MRVKRKESEMEEDERETIKVKASMHYCEYCNTYVSMDEWFDSHFICPVCGAGE